MIINYDFPGQLCNRIWSLVPSIAYGLEYNEKVLIINFEEYSAGFDDLNKNKLVSFKPKKLLKRIIFSLKARGYIQNGKSNIILRLLRLNMIEGWSNRLGNQQMVINQSEKIRSIFLPEKSIRDAVDPVFDAFEKDMVVVGLHMRRGDYKTWRNGQYYYTDEVYASVMQRIQQQVKNKHVKFLLCSNEALDLQNFSNFDCFVIPDTSGLKDLYALSKCSYILGPPSTYSQWASFMGKTPLKFLMAADEKIEMSMFSKIVSLDNFENKDELKLVNI